jgi:hypothetical protein
LKSCRGSPCNLLGVHIYHDFQWLEVFRDTRVQFRNGLSLAKLARSECPSDKRPALLLTIDEEADETPIDDEDEHILVVRITSYLRTAGSDAAAAYFAHKLKRGIPLVGQYQELAESPDAMGAFLDQHLSIPLIQ